MLIYTIKMAHRLNHRLVKQESAVSKPSINLTFYHFSCNLHIDQKMAVANGKTDQGAATLYCNFLLKLKLTFLKEQLAGSSFNLLELVVGLDKLMNESLSSLRVSEHGPKSGSELSSCSLVQKNQI